MRDGSLLATADDAENGWLLVRAMMKGHPPPKLGDGDVTAILIKPSRQLYYFEGSIWVRWRAPYAAIGTGSSYALGALAMGASAIEAVRIGIQFDAHSGGRIHSYKLSKKKRE